MGKHIPLWALPPFLPVTFSGGPYPFLFIPVFSFRSLHADLFMPENFLLDFPERLLITWSWETLTDFEKKPALNSLTSKLFKSYFVFLIAGLFRNCFIFYTSPVFAKVLAVFRQSGSFHMSLTITNFFQQWDFLCNCLLSANRKNPFSHKITNRFRDIFSISVKKHSVKISACF